MKKALPLLILAGLAVSISTRAAGVRIELPRETLTYRSGAGVELANTRCLVCHSADYAVTQPPLPRAFWKGNVDKMRQKYGAVIPEGELEPLINYLATVYGTEKRGPTTANPSLPGSAAGVGDGDAAKLAAQFACVACHGLGRKIVGPAFRDIAAKYRAQPDAPEKVARQIMHGGGGQWGPVPMPPFPQIPAPDVQRLALWVLAQK